MHGMCYTFAYRSFLISNFYVFVCEKPKPNEVPELLTILDWNSDSWACLDLLSSSSTGLREVINFLYLFIPFNDEE